jgi:hypothetical protein
MLTTLRSLANESRAAGARLDAGCAVEMTPRHKRPVFVVGCPRSGTTLLYHMLLSSGRFLIHMRETHAFDRIGPSFGNLAARRDRERLIDEWDSTNLANTEVNPADIRASVVNECENVGDLLKLIMETMAHDQKAARWAEKTPDHILYLHEIKRTLPDALIIHIIRDGRDVALSLAAQKWVRAFAWDKHHDVLVCGLYWAWMIDVGRHLASTLGSDYLEVRFEDLLSTPRVVLDEIGQFIQQDLDYDRIRQAGIGAVNEPNTSFDKKLNDGVFHPIDRWRSGFSAEALPRFEALVGPLLTKLGYHLATAESELPKSLELWRLRAFYRSYFSLRRWFKSHLPLARYLMPAQLCMSSRKD